MKLLEQEIEHLLILNAIDTLCILCVGDKEFVIDKLTNHLWDEEEANEIKSLIKEN